jgi:signal recognition particle subunit SEC65
MTVYVDEPIYRFGRCHMCHMMADTTEELLEMAKNIGLKPEWIQDAGTPREHFDVSKTYRWKAVKDFGAKEVKSRDLALLMRRKRGDQP